MSEEISTIPEIFICAVCRIICDRLKETLKKTKIKYAVCDAVLMSSDKGYPARGAETRA